MQIKHNRSKWTYLLVLQVSLLIAPVFFTVQWIRIASNPETGHREAVETFLSGFPGILRDPTHSSMVLLICAVAALSIGLWIQKQFGQKSFKLICCKIGIGFSGILSLWLLFTFM